VNTSGTAGGQHDHRPQPDGGFHSRPAPSGAVAFFCHRVGVNARAIPGEHLIPGADRIAVFLELEQRVADDRDIAGLSASTASNSR
jgi:hypothetical protein